MNMVVEIPRWTDGKIEISRDEPLSTPSHYPPPYALAFSLTRSADPIFHDKKNGKPRFVESVWPHKSYPFAYGSIPQTWESPNFDHEFTELPGDNDPVDIIDIGDE